jgi:hypothetical protein
LASSSRNRNHKRSAVATVRDRGDDLLEFLFDIGGGVSVGFAACSALAVETAGRLRRAVKAAAALCTVVRSASLDSPTPPGSLAGKYQWQSSADLRRPTWPVMRLFRFLPRGTFR